MINIKRETIIKAGDLLKSADEKEIWEVKNMVGFKIFVFNIQTNEEAIFLKNNLIIQHWILDTKNTRGYW